MNKLKQLAISTILIFTLAIPAFAASNKAIVRPGVPTTDLNGITIVPLFVNYSTCISDVVVTSVDLNASTASLNNLYQDTAKTFINGLDNGGDPNCGGPGTIVNRDHVRCLGCFTS